MKPFAKRYGPSVLSAVALSMAFPTWSLFPLAWIALTPLLLECSSISAAQAAKRFLLVGWITHAILLRWVLVHVFWVGGWAIVGNVFLALYYALFWGALGFAWRWLDDRIPKIPSALLLAILWAGLEQFQTYPQVTPGSVGSMAYSQGPNLALLQLTSLGGPALLAFIIVLANGCLASAISTKTLRARYATAFILVLAISHGVGALLIDDAEYDEEPFMVGILQSDFSIEMKHDPEYWDAMVQMAAEKSARLDEKEPLDLMVWPEALIMDSAMSPAIRRSISEFTTGAGTPLFTGAARSEGGHYNSSYLFDTEGEIAGVYDKVRLAPFGEYLPWGGVLSPLSSILPSSGWLTPGEDQKTFAVGERRLGPLICFEVFFPAMSRALRDDEADFLVVVTNLGWFGQSHLVMQEFHVARIRAIENRMPLVHAANTGISGVFDPYGRFEPMKAVITREGIYADLIDDLPLENTIQHRLVGAFPLPNSVESSALQFSFYVGWAFPALCCILIFLGVWAAVRRPAGARDESKSS